MTPRRQSIMSNRGGAECVSRVVQTAKKRRPSGLRRCKAKSCARAVCRRVWEGNDRRIRGRLVVDRDGHRGRIRQSIGTSLA